jgi:hypothetical protein
MRGLAPIGHSIIRLLAIGHFTIGRLTSRHRKPPPPGQPLATGLLRVPKPSISLALALASRMRRAGHA